MQRLSEEGIDDNYEDDDEEDGGHDDLRSDRRSSRRSGRRDERRGRRHERNGPGRFTLSGNGEEDDDEFYEEEHEEDRGRSHGRSHAMGGQGGGSSMKMHGMAGDRFGHPPAAGGSYGGRPWGRAGRPMGYEGQKQLARAEAQQRGVQYVTPEEFRSGKYNGANVVVRGPATPWFMK